MKNLSIALSYKEYLESHKEIDSQNQKFFRSIEKKVNKLSDVVGYLKYHDEYADFCRGIEREEIGIPKQTEGSSIKESAIIRTYNPELKKNQNEELISTYKIFLANRILATEKIIDIEVKEEKEKNNLKAKLVEIFKKSDEKLNSEELKNIKNAKDLEKQLKKFGEKFDIFLGDFLSKNQIKNAPDKMEKTFAFNLFNYEKKIIITAVKIGANAEFTHLLIENPIDPFFEEKRKDFLNNFETSKWFLGLDDFRKNLIRNHKEKIFSNKHVLSKLLYYIPGLKNAFERTDVILDKDGVIISLAENVHMASQTVLSKDSKESQKLTNQNFDLLTSKFNNKISLCSLISPNDIFQGEKEMYNLVQKKVNEQNENNLQKNKFSILYSPMAMNFTSKLPGSEKFQIQNVKMIIEHMLNEIHSISTERPISKKEKLKFDAKNIYEKINELTGKNSKIDNFLNAILDLLRFVFDFKFSSNKQMQLYEKFNEFVNEYNKIMSNEKKYMIVINCRSGKDRTGIMQNIFSYKSLTQGIQNAENMSNLNYQDILDSLNDGNHLFYLNGSIYGGNSAGSYGILPHSEKLIDPEYQNIFTDSNLFTDLAKGGRFSSKSPSSLITLDSLGFKKELLSFLDFSDLENITISEKSKKY